MNNEAGREFPLHEGTFFINDDLNQWKQVTFEDALLSVSEAVSAKSKYEITIDKVNKSIFISS